MVSIKSRLVSTIIAKRYYKSRHASVEEHYDDVIENVEARTAPTVVPKNISGESAFRVTQEDFNGWEVFHLKPTSGLSDKAIVYWHGGAFVKEIAEQHWDFCSRLVRELKVPIIIPMYTLAPKGNAAEWEANAIKLCVQLSKDERYRSLDVVHMGDSAGGWCVLRLLEALCEKALEGDAEVEHALKSTTKGVMYSPLVSMEVTDNLMKIAESDIWLGPDLIHAITPLWCVGPQAVPRVLKALSPEVQAQHSAPATEISLVDPKYSPLYGLDVFTKYHEAKPDHAPFNLLVFSGTADITWAGTSQLEAKVNALGNDVIKYEQQVEQNIYHVYQLTPIPEAEKAWKKTKEFLQ